MTEYGYAEDSDPRYVYTFWGEGDRCLYVGYTVDFPRRLRSHMRSDWWPEVVRMDVVVQPDRESGHAAERELIGRLRPAGNVVMYLHDRAVAS